MNQIILPRLAGMYPHQIELLKDPHRFKTIIWHRRARKTTTALEKLLIEAHNPNIKNKVYWMVFPTYGEAKDAVWTDPSMLFRIIPRELIAKTNESELTVYFKSGSILMLKGADKPERLLGAGPYGVVLDEFAEMKYETWTRIVEPILRANGGWCWFVGTPKGKNHLYQLYLRGLEGHLEWKSWLLKASESGVIPLDQLEASIESMPQSLYNQEWECNFLEGEGSVFRNVKQVATAKIAKPIPNHIYVIGADLARVRDYTVLTVFDRENNNQVFQDRFQTLDWAFQTKRIKALSERYNNAMVVVDATGLGDAIVDTLARLSIPVEPYRISEPSKKELIEKLSIWIDQKRLKILPIEDSINELEAFSYEIGPTGRIRYSAPEGYHDDIVISLALAVYFLNPKSTDKVESNEESILHQSKMAAYMNRGEAVDISELDWNEWGAV